MVQNTGTFSTFTLTNTYVKLNILENVTIKKTMLKHQIQHLLQNVSFVKNTFDLFYFKYRHFFIYEKKRNYETIIDE